MEFWGCIAGTALTISSALNTTKEAYQPSEPSPVPVVRTVENKKTPTQPISELKNMINEAEKDKQFLPPSLELENSSLDIQKEIIKSDLYTTNSQLQLAQSYLNGYVVISQSDKDAFGREIIAYQAKMQNLTAEFQNPNADISKLSEQLLEASKQIDNIQQTFEDNLSRTTLPIGSFETYSQTIPKVSPEEISLRQKFGQNMKMTNKNLQIAIDNQMITNQQAMQIKANFYKLTRLARYNNESGASAANRQITEINKQITSLFNNYDQQKQIIQNLTIPEPQTPQPVPTTPNSN